MQIIGVILIVFVVALYVWWIIYTKNQHAVAAKVEAGVQSFDIEVQGVYAPSIIEAEVGKPVRINFTRKESNECSRWVNFSHLLADGKNLNIRKELPENETVSIEFTPDKAGEYSFTCDMSMYQGKLIIK